jgi:hypothetical protein
MGFAIESN